MSDLILEQMKQLAEQLTPTERARMVEWLNDTLQATAANSPSADSTSWGKEIVALLTEDQDMGEWDKVDIPDPEAWVHELRRQNRVEINE